MRIVVAGSTGTPAERRSRIPAGFQVGRVLPHGSESSFVVAEAPPPFGLLTLGGIEPFRGAAVELDADDATVPQAAELVFSWR